MGGERHLCYKASGPTKGHLCFKVLTHPEGGKLVYKSDSGKVTTISLAWGSDGKDLDICAYWLGAPDMVAGYGWNLSTSERVSGAYHLQFSGDIRSSDDSEWVKIRMSPWSAGNRSFRIHFNYFEYSEAYPANTCTVIASQKGGKTLIKKNVPCATRAGNGNKAKKSDPYVTINFDEAGKLVEIV